MSLEISFILISLHFTVGRRCTELRLFNTLGLESSDGHFSGNGNDRNDSILHSRVGGKEKTNDEKWNDKIVWIKHRAIVSEWVKEKKR